MLRKAFLIPPFALAAALCAAQTSQAPAADAGSMAPVMNDPVQGGWNAERISAEAGDWQRLASDQATSGIARLNHFRSERNAALARNQGSLTPADRADLERIARDLETASPNSFEAHLARYHLAFPDPSASMHLDLAKARDRARQELTIPLLMDAARRFDQAALVRQSRVLKERGGVAPGLWRMADDILRSVDRDGVLIAAGEMDACPLWAKQHAEGARKDVLVVDARLLGDPAYRQRVWAMTRARGAVPGEASGFTERLAAAMDRPVFLSMALGPGWVGPLREHLHVTGLALRYSTSPLDNIPALEERWKRFHKDTGAGPLARNYLLPGAVLLRHYRAVGDEAGAARMERELRGLAEKLGETARMVRSGLFQP